MNSIVKLAKASVAILLVALAAASASAADLQKIEDRLAIEEMYARYVYALDTADADAYAGLFIKDGFLSIGGEPYNGRDAIHKVIAALRDRPAFKSIPVDTHGRRFSHVRHVVTSFKVDIKGDTATAESFWMEVKANGKDPEGLGFAPTVLNMGRYEDELVKQGGQWLFAKRIVVGDMVSKPRRSDKDPPATY